VSPLAFEVVRSRPLPLADIRDGWWQTHIAPLVAEATAPLGKAGVAGNAIRLRCRLDMRYTGQGHEVEIALPEHAAQLDAAALAALFEARYTALYTHTLATTPVQIMTWKVEAVGPDPLGGQAIRIEGPAMRRPARRARRTAHMDEAGPIECAVYDRSFLAHGDLIEGPALIEEPDSTCMIGPGDIARIDAEENLVVDLALNAVTATAVAAEPAL
jgi:N-methylhydantoinase A